MYVYPFVMQKKLRQKHGTYWENRQQNQPTHWYLFQVTILALKYSIH